MRLPTETNTKAIYQCCRFYFEVCSIIVQGFKKKEFPETPQTVNKKPNLTYGLNAQNVLFTKIMIKTFILNY